MSDPEFLRTIRTAIADQVRRHRTAQGLTIQALSDRCLDLGVPLSRVTITKIENKAREHVGIEELIALGEALGVSPMDLMFPPDEENLCVEFLPAQYFPTTHCARRFTGQPDQPTLGRISVLARQLARLADGSGEVRMEEGAR